MAGGFGSKLELNVISKAVKLKSMKVDYVTKWSMCMMKRRELNLGEYLGRGEHGFAVVYAD